MPTLRGWVVGASGIVVLVFAAALSRSDLLFVGLVLTLAPFAAMVAVALERPTLTATRAILPDSVAAGEVAEVRLRVRNDSARAAAGFAWADALPPAIAPVRRRALPVLAGAGGAARAGGPGSAVLRYSALALRRGAYLLGPLRVDRTDPFGLARCGYDVGEAKALVVTPRVSVLGPRGPGRARGDGTAPELVRRSIPSADEVIPRDYHPGDPLRRVQWRATARQGRVMVRQEEQLSNPAALVLLDTLAARAGSSEAFERAVDLAASVAMHLLELGYLVGVHETGERRLTGSYELPGGDHLLLGQLASIEQTPEPQGDVAGRLTRALRGDAGAPAFLILVDGGGDAWRGLAELSRYAVPAVAFLLTRASWAARAELEAVGWVCVSVDADTDPSAAWSRAVDASSRQGAGGGPGAGRA